MFCMPGIAELGRTQLRFLKKEKADEKWDRALGKLAKAYKKEGEERAKAGQVTLGKRHRGTQKNQKKNLKGIGGRSKSRDGRGEAYYETQC